MIIDENGRYKCVCDLCNHQWYPRGGREPYKCPNFGCQSTKWNEEDVVLSQLDILQLKELRDKQNKDKEIDADMIDSDAVESKVRKTLQQMEHEKNLELSLRNTNERLKKMEEKFGELEECPSCHRGVPSNSRRCSFCDAEYEQGDE